MASGPEAESTASADQEETQATEGQDGSEATEEEGGAASGRSVASAIEDVSSLPGETVNDQDGRKIGQVKEIYAVGEDETPMWVTIESSTGLGRHREVFVPLARIKKQHDEIRVPYSYAHIHEAPEVEPGDELSEEDDRALRSYYAVGLADQELVQGAKSYASQVPDDEEPARKVEGSAAEGPVREIDDTPSAERVAEAYEKQKEEEGEEHRTGRGATADAVVQDDDEDGKKDEDESDRQSEEQSEDQSEEQSEDQSKAQSEDQSKD